MTVPDSPVAATFVAAPDNWGRGGAAPRAIVIHHAEGGGTVGWLTRNDGNSSHYVVEYSGRVVQMVAEDRSAGSMNPNLTRKSDDPAYTFEGSTVKYGRSALDASGIAGDPNRYAIAIEVEGFAEAGPNAAQRASLKRLVADIRRRNGPLPALGHRDQQSYKPCPGHKIPWADYGGHGVKTMNTEEAMQPLEVSTTEAKLVYLPDGRQIYNPDGTDLVKVSLAGDRYSPFGVKVGGDLYRLIHVNTGGSVKVGMVRSAGLTMTDPPAPAATDCSVQVAAAVASAKAEVASDLSLLATTKAAIKALLA